MTRKQNHGARLLIAVGTAFALATYMLAAGQAAYAAGPTAVGLGTADGFAVLAGSGMTNTGISTITGAVGSSPTHTETGFDPCPAADCVSLTGVNHNAADPNDGVTQGAKTALVTAYNTAAGMAGATPVASGHLGGLTLIGGVYNAGSSTLDLTGTLTLDGEGDANSVWVFQAPSDLITASASSVAFINEGQPCNVFWQVTSSATLGSGSNFAGTIMALTSITMGNGVTLNGRALARNGNVTLIGDTITRSVCTSAVATPPLSATAGSSSSNNTLPLIPLILILGVSELGLAALLLQRRNLYR
jgi:hypothetical protein